MEYRELKGRIRNHLNSAAEDFFMVGYFLRQVNQDALFTEDGYKNIWEFAKGEYGLSTSSTSRFMAINARFSVDDGVHMAEKYIGMGVSKLQEMLGLPDEELEKVTQETTVREIRAMKKKQEEEAKSFFGVPKTVYPEGSLLTTPGCGDGKYNCFSCAHPCDIRQEERHCRTATCGNPFPCTQMSEKKRLSIDGSVFGARCQHLHPELAPIQEGNKDADPCCLTCKHKTCFFRCDIAIKRDKDEQRKQVELQKRPQNKSEDEMPEQEVEEEPITAQEPEAESDPEKYDQLDVDLLLDKYRRDLKSYHEAECPPNIIKKQKILVDALTFLLERLDQGGAED